MIDQNPPGFSLPRFSIRGLLVTVAFAVVFCGWFSDRLAFSRKLDATESLYRERIVLLESQLAKAEKLQDADERALLTNAVVGDLVTAHPNIRRLSDYVFTRESRGFQQIHEYVTYPDDRVPCKHCEIFLFELDATGREGDPFDFSIMACDGVIVKVRRGESLNS